MRQLRDNVWYLPFVEANDHPNLGYIAGSRYALMVDAGFSSTHAAEFCGKVKELGQRRPDFVFLTHYHWDHTFGLAGVSDMVSLALRCTNEKLDELAEYVWDDVHLEEYVADNRIPLFSKPHFYLEYPGLQGIEIRRADVTFETELTIDLGGERCRMKKLTTPHSEDCAWLLAEQARVLFLGDGGYERVEGLEWVDDKEKLRRQMSELEELPFDICVLGHHEPVSKKELFDGFRERLQRAEG